MSVTPSYDEMKRPLEVSGSQPKPQQTNVSSLVGSLLTPWTFRFAAAVLGASFFLPVFGFGVDLCPLHRLTDLPCPGCGMTRALAMVSQGEWSLALGAHPFVIFLWPVVLVLALLAFAPASLVARVKSAMHRPLMLRIQSVLLYAFLAFGLLRFGVLLALGETFP